MDFIQCIGLIIVQNHGTYILKSERGLIISDHRPMSSRFELETPMLSGTWPPQATGRLNMQATPIEIALVGVHECARQAEERWNAFVFPPVAMSLRANPLNPTFLYIIC